MIGGRQQLTYNLYIRLFTGIKKFVALPTNSQHNPSSSIPTCTTDQHCSLHDLQHTRQLLQLSKTLWILKSVISTLFSYFMGFPSLHATVFIWNLYILQSLLYMGMTEAPCYSYSLSFLFFFSHTWSDIESQPHPIASTPQVPREGVSMVRQQKKQPDAEESPLGGPQVELSKFKVMQAGAEPAVLLCTLECNSIVDKVLCILSRVKSIRWHCRERK